MKKLVVLFAALALVVSFGASAQNRGSLEISTGYSPIHSLVGVSTTFEGTLDGYAPCINIGYNFAMNDTWDFVGIVDICGGKYQVYDYSRGTESATFHGTVSIIATFRRSWFRNENIKLYSAAGVGINPWIRMGDSFLPYPLPYCSPIGINFGKGRVYGVSEVTVGPAASGWLIGLGIRL